MNGWLHRNWELRNILLELVVTEQLVDVAITLGLFQRSMLIVAKPFLTLIRLLLISWPSDIIEGAKRDDYLRKDLFAEELIQRSKSQQKTELATMFNIKRQG